MNDIVLATLLEAACLAPSVDNCQPWRFVCFNDSVDIFLDRERADFFGDYGFAASYATIGAAVENMQIAASHLDMVASVTCFPSDDVDHVATVKFSDAAVTPDPLCHILPLRCTNRKKYSSASLSQEQRDALCQSAQLSGAKLYLFEEHSTVKELFRLAAQVDSIIFDHPLLHANLYRWIRWSPQEKSQTCDGMPVGSLEIDAFQKLFFRIISSFRMLKFFNIFGVNRLIGLLNSSLLLRSSALGMIVMDGTSNVDYLNGGRCMERVWLTASALGLAYQPFGGLPFLLTRMLRGGNEGFSEKQYSKLQGVFRTLQRHVPITPGNGLVIFFRVGTAAAPTERSIRRPLSEVAQLNPLYATIAPPTAPLCSLAQAQPPH
jgi:hypothetical protein